MTDRELEQRLRAWYRAEVPADEAAPAAFRSALAAIPKASPAPWRRLGSRRGFTLLAAAALLGTSLVGGALIAGSHSNNAPSVAAPSDALQLASPVSHLRSRPTAWPATERSP